MKELYLIILLGCSFQLQAQFAPPAGQPGTTALHADSVQWACWANNCTVNRGYMNISNQGLGPAISGTETDAVGPAADGAVLSLGDGGTATLSFPYPIRNGNGADFAVFENAFSNTFLELAFVEVSSDGINFVRFPAVSNSDTAVQIGTFGAIDATEIHNLAGKYRYGYGTPFDLEDLKDALGIDVENITHVRIIDVVGSINPEYCSRDSRGVIINDPWTTPFNEGGFDLDAVGVIHAKNQAATDNFEGLNLSAFPNPISNGYFSITFNSAEALPCQIYNMQGQLLMDKTVISGEQISCYDWASGIYFVKINGEILKLVLSKL